MITIVTYFSRKQGLCFEDIKSSEGWAPPKEDARVRNKERRGELSFPLPLAHGFLLTCFVIAYQNGKLTDGL